MDRKRGHAGVGRVRCGNGVARNTEVEHVVKSSSILTRDEVAVGGRCHRLLEGDLRRRKNVMLSGASETRGAGLHDRCEGVSRIGDVEAVEDAVERMAQVPRRTCPLPRKRGRGRRPALFSSRNKKAGVGRRRQRRAEQDNAEIGVDADGRGGRGNGPADAGTDASPGRTQGARGGGGAVLELRRRHAVAGCKDVDVAGLGRFEFVTARGDEGRSECAGHVEPLLMAAGAGVRLLLPFRPLRGVWTRTRSMKAGSGMGTVIGWDIGGAHLKAARAEAGRIVKAVQLAAPLRGGVDLLAAAFAKAKSELMCEPGGAERHVATMTGELADTFASRAEGVESLATLAAHELAGAPLAIYAGPAGYVAPGAAARHAGLVASANWHACASFVAGRRGDAIFIDMGSTTTDVIPISGGAPAARGYTDAERLAVGELVYTGLVRSFLMASADRAPFKGVWTTLINENFANMADVYRVLGTLPADADMMGTADGRDKTRKASLARLARMVGADVADADDAAWTALAQWFAELQVRRVMDAAMLTGSHWALRPDAPVVGAGAGVQVVQEVARRLGRRYVAFDTLLDAAPEARAAASQCAPAAALALLNG